MPQPALELTYSCITDITNSFATVPTESQWSISLQKAIMTLFQSWTALFPFSKARQLALPPQFNICTRFLKRQNSSNRRASTFRRQDEVLGHTRQDKF